MVNEIGSVLNECSVEGPSGPMERQQLLNEMMAESLKLEPSRLTEVQKANTDATRFLDALAKNPNLSAEQKRIAVGARDYPERNFAALLIKESRLKETNISQITPGAREELLAKFPLLRAEIQAAPTQLPLNLLCSRLYIVMQREAALQQEPSLRTWSKLDQIRLGNLIYNLGLTATLDLYAKMGKPKNMKDLLEAMEAHVGGKIGKTGPSHWTRDLHYNVIYEQSSVAAHYLANRDDPRLDQPAFPGASYPTNEKILISSRYVRIIWSLEDALQLYEAPKTWETYTVQRGDTLSNIGLRYGVSPRFLEKVNANILAKRSPRQTILPKDKLSVPHLSQARPFFYEQAQHPWILATNKGFYSQLVSDSAYARYLTEQIGLEPEDIEEGVIAFNRWYNPELACLNEQATNIPKGAFIWIPNLDFFKLYVLGEDAKIEETPPPPIETIQKPTAAPSLTDTFRETSELLLDRSGQYVIRKGGKWKLDVDQTREGAERFATKKWEEHPAWNTDHLGKRSTLGLPMGEVKYIILHSTISPDSQGTINGRKAHFVVERDGTIKYLVYVKKGSTAKDMVPPHAGFSQWDGQKDLNFKSIGIEVVADERQEWSEAQFKAMKNLVHWLGGYYGLPKSSVLTHSQIAYSKWGRGRKSDPYYQGSSVEFFKKLGLPDNASLLDLEVASGKLASNSAQIKRDSNFNQKAWLGLEAAEAIKKR